VLSIIGLSKSSGKTRCLNRLIQAHHHSGTRHSLAVTSVGHGGEVRLFEGMYAATAAGLLGEADFTRLIRHTSGINTPLGEVVVTQALSNGRVGLAGPSINSQLSALCRYMLAELNAGQIMVDGSGDKRTFAADSDGVILCTGANSNRDLSTTARECAHICRLMSLPSYTGTHQEDAIIHNIPGALTNEMLSDISNNNDIKRTTIIVTDASKIFVNSDTLNKYQLRGGSLFVENPANLVAVVLSVDSTMHDTGSFLDIIQENVAVPVFGFD